MVASPLFGAPLAYMPRVQITALSRGIREESTAVEWSEFILPFMCELARTDDRAEIQTGCFASLQPRRPGVCVLRGNSTRIPVDRSHKRRRRETHSRDRLQSRAVANQAGIPRRIPSALPQLQFRARALWILPTSGGHSVRSKSSSDGYAANDTRRTFGECSPHQRSGRTDKTTTRCWPIPVLVGPGVRGLSEDDPSHQARDQLGGYPSFAVASMMLACISGDLKPYPAAQPATTPDAEGVQGNG
jgi:hypothetical protein